MDVCCVHSDQQQSGFDVFCLKGRADPAWCRSLEVKRIQYIHVCLKPVIHS